MNKKMRILFLLFFLMFGLFSLSSPSYSTGEDTIEYFQQTPLIESPPPIPFENTPYYNTRALGIAGNFHIVGFNSVRLNAHTNGNILANILYANVNFGTNNLVDELSYVSQYAQVHPGSATSLSHVFVVGNTNQVELVDNGNAIAINGTKLDRPKNVWKDGDTPYIDLQQIHTEMQSLSTTLQSYPTNNVSQHLNPAGGSVDESYIQLVNPDESGVFHISATQLSSLRYLGVKGFSSSTNTSLIINVDCEGVSQLNLPISLISIDGQNQSLSETHEFTKGRVLFNFYNYLPNSATTITASLLHASVLAPGVNFNATQNLNGTIIANNVSVYAETHRDDFISYFPTPSIPYDIEVKKTWLQSDLSPLNSDAYQAIIQLLRDGTPYGERIILDKNNNFSYTFSDLDDSYTYTLEEVSIWKEGVDVSELFDVSIQNNVNNITITNTLIDKEPLILPATGGYAYNFIYLAFTFLFISGILFIQTRRK